MSRLPPERPEFRTWVDKQADPDWDLMPLTHVTSGIVAVDIIRAGAIQVSGDGARAFFFYGRAAYRTSHEDAIRREAACPVCFIMEPSLVEEAAELFAFDSGAFGRRLYKSILSDEMNIRDFSLASDLGRPNKLVSRAFGSQEAYFAGDLSVVPPSEEITETWEFQPRAYLDLLRSPGRNEPDDRVCSIEVTFDHDVPLKGHLKAVVVPHTFWTGEKRAPWLDELADVHVVISTYTFVPGRPPEHYHTLMEASVLELYKKWGS